MSIKEVAKKSGYSITTVSRVLNAPETVNEKTRAKIETVMKELNYTPNWFARNLHSNRTNNIGVIIPDTQDPSEMIITRGIENIARQKGCDMMLCTTDFSRETEREQIKSFIERGIDGLILFSTSLNKSDLDEIKERGIPYVLAGKGEHWENENLVYTNYYESVAGVVDYLVEMGREKIAIVTAFNPKCDNKEKLEGYKAGLVRNGMDFDPDMVVSGENTMEGGFLATNKLIDSESRPDAIFVSTDNMAFGAIECLKQNDLGVKDVAIVGFDDLQVGAVMEPKLTTVTKPSYRIGLTVARLLFDLIEDQSHSAEPQAIMLQSRLKIRRSCGNTRRLKEIW